MNLQQCLALRKSRPPATPTGVYSLMKIMGASPKLCNDAEQRCRSAKLKKNS
jgi:hypothetical protein